MIGILLPSRAATVPAPDPVRPFSRHRRKPAPITRQACTTGSRCDAETAFLRCAEPVPRRRALCVSTPLRSDQRSGKPTMLTASWRCEGRPARDRAAKRLPFPTIAFGGEAPGLSRSPPNRNVASRMLSPSILAAQPVCATRRPFTSETALSAGTLREAGCILKTVYPLSLSSWRGTDCKVRGLPKPACSPPVHQ